MIDKSFVVNRRDSLQRTGKNSLVLLSISADKTRFFFLAVEVVEVRPVFFQISFVYFGYLS